MDRKQYSTFVVGGKLYGIDVTRVQEVVRPLPMTRVPLAAPHVRGLINLRGQVATAVGLRELFLVEADAALEPSMNVVCRNDGNLVSLLVDEIGDVIEVDAADYEATPLTVPEHVRRNMAGVYKLKQALLSILDIDRIIAHLHR